MTTTKGMETPLPYMGPTLFPCHMAYLLTPPDESDKRDEEERPDDGLPRNRNTPSTPNSASKADRGEIKQLSSPTSGVSSIVSPFPLSDTLSVVTEMAGPMSEEKIQERQDKDGMPFAFDF